MKKENIIFSCLILFHLLIISYTLKCQENEIENCIKCETGDNSDKC